MKATIAFLSILILASCSGISASDQESNEAVSSSVKLLPDSKKSRMPIKRDSSIDQMPTLKAPSSGRQ